MRILDMNRPTIGAVSVGLAQGALDAAIKYAGERRQFGKAIAEFQGLQFMLSDMAMQVEAARALVYDCASTADAGFESDAVRIFGQGVDGKMFRERRGHEGDRRCRADIRRRRLHEGLPR